MKSLFTIIPILLVLTACQTYSNIKTESKSFDFFLYDGLYENDVKEIIQALEDNRQRIITDLKPELVPRAEIHIWDNRETWAKDNKLVLWFHPNAGGYVERNRVKFIILEETDITEHKNAVFQEFHNMLLNPINVAIHEYSHLITANIDKKNFKIPDWLWESIACYEAKTFFDISRITTDLDKIIQPFSKLDGDIGIYMVGYSIIEYIIKNWGESSIHKLVKNHGDTKQVLGIDQTELEEGFWEYIRQQFFTPVANKKLQPTAESGG